MASIGEMLKNVNHGKLTVSPVRVHATVEATKNMPQEDMSYHREEMKRLKAEIKAIDQALEEWIPEDVAAKAKRSLENERALKKAQLLECALRCKQHEEEMSEDSDEEEESEEEE